MTHDEEDHDREARGKTYAQVVHHIGCAIDMLKGAQYVETEAGSELIEHDIAELTRLEARYERFIPQEPGPLDRPTNGHAIIAASRWSP